MSVLLLKFKAEVSRADLPAAGSHFCPPRRRTSPAYRGIGVSVLRLKYEAQPSRADILNPQ